MLSGAVVTLRRYGLAAMAPATVSVAQFILQMALLKAGDATAFGLFAFILGFIQFGFGLSNALVSTPYTIHANEAGFDAAAPCYFYKVNLVFSAVWGVLCGLGAWGLGSSAQAWIFGVFGFLAMIRWFGRAHLYAVHRPARAALSDLAYSVTLLVALAGAWFAGLSIVTAMAVLCVATAAGMLIVGRAFIEAQFRHVWGPSIRDYGSVWREQARWTLLGVVSSEATSNAHAYAVSLWAGPAAFAPIAAATLLIKPIALATTSLTQLERPVMTRYFGAGNVPAALRSMAVFRAALIGIWGLTIAAATVLLIRFPHLLLKPSYDINAVSMAFALWAAISLLQSWSTPQNVLLQAAQKFKPLARAGVLSAVVATLLVLISVVLLPPVDTLFGIVIGQAVMNLSMTSLQARLRLGATPSPPVGVAEAKS